MRVLLVEDDPMIGASIQHGLQQDGFSVDWVQDGEGVALMLRTTAYALLLLDLGLPHSSGLEVLAAIRRSHNPLPVVILTVRDAVADRVRGLDSGADDYLVKPFDLDELTARIRAVLRHRSGRADAPAPLYGRGDGRTHPIAVAHGHADTRWSDMVAGWSQPATPHGCGAGGQYADA